MAAGEDDVDGTVTVTTSGVEDGQVLTLTLNGQSYTGSVSSNTAAVTIPAADLQALNDGQDFAVGYIMATSVSDAAGNAA